MVIIIRFSSRSIVKSTCFATSVSVKAFECELCKQVYNLTVDYHGKIYELTPISIPNNEPFILMESTSNLPNMLFCLVKFNSKKTLRVGRNNISDVKLTDSSISRNHAIIKYTDGEFILEDNFSKFGTSILVNKPICIKEDDIAHFQSGETMFSVSIKKSKKNKMKKIPIKPIMDEEENLFNNEEVYLISLKIFKIYICN